MLRKSKPPKPRGNLSDGRERNHGRSPLPTNLPGRFRCHFGWLVDRRTRAVRELATTYLRLTDALGGIDQLSPPEQMLAQRAAWVHRRLTEHEEATIRRDPVLAMTESEYLAAVNTLAGLLNKIGIKRRPRDVSLVDILREASSED